MIFISLPSFEWPWHRRLSLEFVHNISSSPKTNRTRPLSFLQRLLHSPQKHKIQATKSPGMWLSLLTLQGLFKSVLDGFQWGLRAPRGNDPFIKNDRAIHLCHRVSQSIPVIPIPMYFRRPFPVVMAVSFVVSIAWCVSLWSYVKWGQLVIFGQTT